MPNTTRLLALACLLGLVACSREPRVPESETGGDAGEMPATPPPAAAPAATARLQMGKGVVEN